MEAIEGQEDPQGHLNFKTWVLKVSVHCEGCKRKVKKILQQVPGVYTIDIDLKQQKATVTGNVEGETLLRKLHKSGKHAELLPQQSDQREKKPAKSKNKEKQINPEAESKEAATTSQNKDVPKAKVVVPLETTGKIQDAPVKAPKKKEKLVKPEEVTGAGGSGGEPVGKGGEDGGEKGESDEPVKESKSEGKKPETVSGGEQLNPVAAAEKKVGDSDNASASGEKSGGGPGGEASGNTGKKKKKKGQNNNNTEGTPSSVATAGTEFHHRDMGPQPVATNASPQRHPGYHSYPQQGPYYYAPPPDYVVSYNTAQPTSSHTTSYYAPAPPTSYAYTYPGPVMQPPPSDLESYPRQPLDSFEMFSDENPNGCFIM